MGYETLSQSSQVMGPRRVTHVLTPGSQQSFCLTDPLMTHPPNFWIEYEEKWNILHLRFYWLVAVVCNLHLRVKDMIQIVFV